MVSYIAIATRNNGKETFYNEEFYDLDEAASSLLGVVLKELGDGDGENGGKGSLFNCSRDIFLSLRSRVLYCYADCEFKVVKTDVGYTAWITCEDADGKISAVNHIVTKNFRYKGAMMDWIEEMRENLRKEFGKDITIHWNYQEVDFAKAN